MSGTLFHPLRMLLVLAAAFFILGCLGSIGGERYATNYLTDLERIAISHPDYVEECRIGSCWCMVCANGSNIFGPITNLVGGHCYFDTNCTQDRVAELGDDDVTPTFSIRHFMIGQGPTFADFASANPYCSHRLSMAVQWLTADEDIPYLLPDASRAMCFLSKDIIPVFVLHSGGENINITRSYDIAHILGTGGRDVLAGRLTDGPVGPVVIVTEIDYNLTSAHEVAEQVRAVNEGCQNDRDNHEIYCFVAVAPKMGDTEALDLVLQEVGDQVDLVAYGINGRYAHSCSGPAIILEAINFSSYALYNHGKPSIIPYVMFDSAGSDAEGTCNWTENSMIAAYGSFFPNGILSLQQRGVIGIAPYSFNSSTYGVSNPLHCIDCGVGKDAARLASWYAWCQSYTNITRRMPTGESTSHPSGSTLIVFPNESGGYCDHTAQLDYILREVSYADAAAHRDYLNPQAPDLRDPTNRYFSCDTCLVTNIELEPYFAFPEVSLPEEACTLYPEVDQWAAQRNVDPMLARAFIWVESNFVQCAAARVCRGGFDDGDCFQAGPGTDECYGKGYTWMEDPSGICEPNLTNAVASPSDAISVTNPDWRWCALGMMQSLTPPYTYWPASHHPDGSDGVDEDLLAVYEDANRRRTADEPTGADPQDYWGNMELAQQCNPYFNPFNASHSICVGTAGLAEALENARGWLSRPENHARLNWPADDFERENIFTAYVAGHKYAGFWDIDTRLPGYERCPVGMPNSECWTRNFRDSWEVDEDYCRQEPMPPECSSPGVPDRDRCYGYTDFVEYMADCETAYLQRDADPGAKRLSAYFWLVRNCPNSPCPDGRALVEGMCADDGTGRYNEDLCLAPGVPRPPTSGTYLIPDDLPEEPVDVSGAAPGGDD